MGWEARKATESYWNLNKIGCAAFNDNKGCQKYGWKMLINPSYAAIFSLGEGQVIEAGGGNLSSSPQQCAQWSHFVTGQE